MSCILLNNRLQGGLAYGDRRSFRVAVVAVMDGVRGCLAVGNPFCRCTLWLGVDLCTPLVYAFCRCCLLLVWVLVLLLLSVAVGCCCICHSLNFSTYAPLSFPVLNGS